MFHKNVCRHGEVVHYVGEVQGSLRLLGVNGVGRFPWRHTAQSPAQRSTKLFSRRLLQNTELCGVLVHVTVIFPVKVIFHL